ncbi:acyltransferase [Enterobacter hormaechei]|uniref:acyltransferase family protein n=1 Tax=Enterobacter hormaechei TaxID=158836 RepID=UPI0015F93318|nr:acyltransferase [Enterobacter hormaechei]QMV77733.1 acyltransferase [Enterobacter hormaechei]
MVAGRHVSHDKEELVNLQILRGIAAMLVVTNHFLSTTIGGVFKLNGGLGVDIFFVLSGFLMIHTMNEKKSSVSFLLSRVKRIYPLYLILSIPLILSTIPLTYTFGIVGNLLLIPSFGDPNYTMANGPSWTLVYEMMFYLMFSACLIFTKNKSLICLVICIVISLCVYSINGYDRYRWVNFGYIIGDPLMLNFAAGCAIACLYEHTKLFKINTILSLLIFIILMRLALVDLEGQERIYKFGIPSVFIILIAIHTRFNSSVLTSALRELGDASYSIYLSHIYVTLIFHSMKDLNRDWNVIIYSSIALCLVSPIFGIFIYRTIEKPITIYLRNRKQPV